MYVNSFMHEIANNDNIWKPLCLQCQLIVKTCVVSRRVLKNVIEKAMELDKTPQNRNDFATLYIH